MSNFMVPSGEDPQAPAPKRRRRSGGLGAAPAPQAPPNRQALATAGMGLGAAVLSGDPMAKLSGVLTAASQAPEAVAQVAQLPSWLRGAVYLGVGAAGCWALVRYLRSRHPRARPALREVRSDRLVAVACDGSGTRCRDVVCELGSGGDWRCRDVAPGKVD